MILKSKLFWSLFVLGASILLVVFYFIAKDRWLTMNAEDEADAVTQVLSWIVEGKSIEGATGRCREAPWMAGPVQVLVRSTNDVWREGANVRTPARVTRLGGNFSDIFVQNQFEKTVYLWMNRRQNETTFSMKVLVGGKVGGSEYVFIFKKHFFPPKVRLTKLDRVDKPNIQEEVGLLFLDAYVRRDADQKVVEVSYNERNVIVPPPTVFFKFAGGMKSLHELKARSLKISDSDLENLGDLIHLTDLRLNAATITDKAGKVIKNFANLRRLEMFDNAMTDEGLANLAGLTKLEVLYVNGPQITDKGLIHIAKLANLQELFVGDDKITDQGMESIKHLVGLRNLRISRTSVTDVGLEGLQGLTRLKELVVPKTITAKGMLALKKRFPRTEVVQVGK